MDVIESGGCQCQVEVEKVLHPVSTLEDIRANQVERDILTVLSTSEDAVYSFQGLKRKIDVHQDKLSKSLKRLEETGVIHNQDYGYEMCCKGDLISASMRPESEIDVRSLIQCSLPGSLSLERVFSSLRGKWFKEWQWLGYVREGDGGTLFWMSKEDNLEVRVRLENQNLFVEVPKGDLRIEERVIQRSYELFSHLNKVIIPLLSKGDEGQERVDSY